MASIQCQTRHMPAGSICFASQRYLEVAPCTGQQLDRVGQRMSQVGRNLPEDRRHSIQTPQYLAGIKEGYQKRFDPDSRTETEVAASGWTRETAGARRRDMQGWCTRPGKSSRVLVGRVKGLRFQFEDTSEFTFRLSGLNSHHEYVRQ